MTIGIIDYGSGNLTSIVRAFEQLKFMPTIIGNPSSLHTVDFIVLPGVGSFADCVNKLRLGDWIDALKNEVIAERKPLLGICIGMQLLADSGSEGRGDGGNTPGLGFISGRVQHLRSLGCQLRTPHVGWNDVASVGSGEPIFKNVADGTDFYFVHSYAFVAANISDRAATTTYGVPVTAAIRKGHIWGTQFHPEKSSKAGLQVLRNFVESSKC